MTQDQPWRNLHPAPSLPEIPSRQKPPRRWGWVRAWWPAMAWAVVIFSLSTDTFSAEKTRSILEPILRGLIPAMTKELFETIHYVIRKVAHFTEYFVFYLFIYRGVRAGRGGWRWTWGIVALFSAAGYSILDEIHQAFVASRTASAYDSLLDSAGAFVAFVALWLWFRRQRERANGVLETT